MTRNNQEMKVTTSEMMQNYVNFPKTVQNNKSHIRNTQKCQEMGQKCLTSEKDKNLKWFETTHKLFRIIDIIIEMMRNAKKHSMHEWKWPRNENEMMQYNTK